MLHEPFNFHVGLRDIDHYFIVPGGPGDPVVWLDRTVERMRSLHLSYKPGLFPEDRGVRRLLKRVVGGRALNSYRRCRWTPKLETIVWKDPFAAFCAGRLAGEHSVDVLVTVRDPWAVAGSFKRMGWGFDLPDLVDRLGRSPAVHDLSDLDLSSLRVDRAHPVRNAAALWTLVYEQLRSCSRRTPRIRFVLLERLVHEPVQTYQRMFESLGLPWSARAAARVAGTYSSDSNRTVPRAGRAHDPDRDLQAVNRYWKDILTADEATVVSQVAGPCWDRLSADLA